MAAELTNGSVGLPSTAGGVLFLSNGGGIEAPGKDGKPLWHSEIGALSSPPETFMLDGKQHVATGAAGLYMSCVTDLRGVSGKNRGSRTASACSDL